MTEKKRQGINRLMLERLIYIHRKIKSGSFPNGPSLAHETECGTATISRDIEFLRDRFGAPIEYSYKERGYYYTDNYDMPLNNISSADFIALSSVKTLLTRYKGTPVYDNLCTAMDILTLPRLPDAEHFINRIAVPPTPQVFVDEWVWSIICTAMRENRIIEFDYNGRWNTETTHRRVRPYQILLDDGKYFLFGYADERKAERLFYCSRIKNPVLTDDFFELPENYEFASRCGGGKFGSFMEESVMTYKIRFYEDARQFVKDCVWADDQVITDYDDEDATDITFSAAQSYPILEWVLSQGGNALPLEPASFVAEWKEQIKSMMHLADLSDHHS